MVLKNIYFYSNALIQNIARILQEVYAKKYNAQV
jgi:hypothetical protein